jgi:hypothetical protein
MQMKKNTTPAKYRTHKKPARLNVVLVSIAIISITKNRQSLIEAAGLLTNVFLHNDVIIRVHRP